MSGKHDALSMPRIVVAAAVGVIVALFISTVVESIGYNIRVETVPMVVIFAVVFALIAWAASPP
jgi:type III secretory pathway component EscS